MYCSRTLSLCGSAIAPKFYFYVYKEPGGGGLLALGGILEEYFSGVFLC